MILLAARLLQDATGRTGPLDNPRERPLQSGTSMVSIAHLRPSASLIGRVSLVLLVVLVLITPLGGSGI
jgi:hypothetical protein